MKKQKQMMIIGGAVVLAVILILIAIFTSRSAAQKKESAQKVQEGINYLEQLEAQEVAAVEDTLKEQRQQERIEKLENGELSVWDQLADAVILGDSRAVGFSYYGFLDTSRVLAAGGDTIANIPDHLEELKSLNPTQVYLCYGLNDVSIGYWNTPEEYLPALEEQMQAIWEVLPDAEIYISSILIARDPAFERSEAWRNIPDYNTAIAAYCEEKGYNYVDNSAICDEHADMWDVDGIHVKKDFYPYWATNLVAATYESEE